MSRLRSMPEANRRGRRSRWRGQPTDRIRSWRETRVGPPTKVVRLVVPQPETPLVEVGTDSGTVIEHWIREHLKGERDLTTLASQQCQCGRQPPTGTRPADGDTGRVNTSLPGEPGQSLVAVVEGCRKWVLWRKPIFHRGHHDPELLCEVAAHRIVLSRRADHITPAMNPEEQGWGCSLLLDAGWCTRTETRPTGRTATPFAGIAPRPRVPIRTNRSVRGLTPHGVAAGNAPEIGMKGVASLHVKLRCLARSRRQGRSRRRRDAHGGESRHDARNTVQPSGHAHGPNSSIRQ